MSKSCCETPRNRPWLWLLFGGAAAIVIAVFIGATRTTSVSAPSDPLVVELEGSYASASRPDGQLRTFAITAAPAQLIKPDGAPLEVWAYNGQVPGPTLRVRIGDTVRIEFKNELPQPTTIHFHGVRVPNAMDGVPGVTQPAVPPGGSFVYEFPAVDAGTFWFHPHVRSSEQVERGLYGVLVVEDDSPPAFTRELVWVVDDWKLAEDGQIAEPFNTRHDLAHDGRWGNVVTTNGSRAPTFPARPGERIRVRIVNVANGRVFKLDFGKVRAEGIAFDALYARESFDPSAMDLAPGNRMDVDLVIPRGGSVEISDRFTRTTHPVAVFEVGGDPVATPTFASPAAATVPHWKDALSTPLTKELPLNAQRGGAFGIAWMIDGVAMQHTAHDHAAHTSFTLSRGRFHRLSFVNESGRLHPMHLHGTFFKVIARNGQPADEPFFRDTVLVRPRERVDIGLVPHDVGTWMMHCHILEHAESGMMTLFAVE
ncbi:MAG: multicopper oxidase family protein [Polyangiaceae bacterium]|nr:multicopper oxidase family protein [Polyangiaceae bacterium]